MNIYSSVLKLKMAHNLNSVKFKIIYHYLFIVKTILLSENTHKRTKTKERGGPSNNYSSSRIKIREIE